MANVSSDPENQPCASNSPDPQAVRIHLARISNSPEFADADRLRQFLQFVVTRTLEGQADRLKEILIGVEFLQESQFDPKKDSIVRTTASRVRAKLNTYYKGPGKDDGLHIVLPKGSYVPCFVFAPKPAEQKVEQIATTPWRPKAKHFAMALWVVVFIAGGVVFWRRVFGSVADGTAPEIRWGRILAKATSEGGSPKVIRLAEQATWLSATPNEEKIYAADTWSRTLSVISTSDDTVKTRTLPQYAGPLAVSPDGARLYVGSRVGGIMVVDTRSDLHAPETVLTAGAVWDLAVTPDGRKLFVAMGQEGVWRFLTKDWIARRLTKQGCPEHLKIAPDGRTLVVSYQCGGPGGGYGHDSAEFFDTGTETSLGTLTGLAFVGGPASFAPDASALVLDGLDACSGPQYDHTKCPPGLSHVFHFIGLPNRRILGSIGLPAATESGSFIDSARVLILGSSLSVRNVSRNIADEEWLPQDTPLGEEVHGFEAVALLPARRKAYINDRQRREVLILRGEDGDCITPPSGLVAGYTGDGVLTDVAGGPMLSAVGGVKFEPGRIGQAFEFDGVSGHLVEHPSGHFRFGYPDSSLALYVNFASLGATMTILDRTAVDGRRSARLARTTDNRLIFEFATAQGTQLILTSKAKLLADRWYHTVVTKADQGLALYVDGVLESRITSRVEPSVERNPIYFGSTLDGKAFLHGKLDEIMFYDRALTADDVHRLYEKRESGPCRM